MAKHRSLVRSTYWPNNGDFLEDEEEGICWEAHRMGTYLDPISGEKLRFGLLLGRHPDFEAPIVRAVHDRDGKNWLAEISTIHRKKGDEWIKYYWSPATESYRA